MTPLQWTRVAPNSVHNFDLVLTNPGELDAQRMTDLLDRIAAARHRAQTLNSRALTAFREWLHNPESPLRSHAYVRLSNWFMTRSGDRHSTLAGQCEAFWDALFPCRPPERLSSPRRNNIMVPAAFDGFWQRVMQAQSDATLHPNPIVSAADRESSTRIDGPRTNGHRVGNHTRMVCEIRGRRFEVHGSPSELAEFVRRIGPSDEG